MNISKGYPSPASAGFPNRGLWVGASRSTVGRTVIALSNRDGYASRAAFAVSLSPILLRPRQQVFRPSPRLAPLLLAAENGERLGGGNGGAYSLPRAKEQAVEPGVLPGLLRSRHEGLVRIALPGIDQQILRQPPQIRNAPFRAFKAAGLDQRQAPALRPPPQPPSARAQHSNTPRAIRRRLLPFTIWGTETMPRPPSLSYGGTPQKALAGTRNHHVRSPSVCGPAASGAAPQTSGQPRIPLLHPVVFNGHRQSAGALPPVRRDACPASPPYR